MHPYTPSLNAEDRQHAERLTEAMSALDAVIVALEDRGDRRQANELAEAFSMIETHRDNLAGRRR